MPRLIHLNGMPRVGKSTLARRYADAHPGTLAIGLDTTGLDEATAYDRLSNALSTG